MQQGCPISAPQLLWINGSASIPPQRRASTLPGSSRRRWESRKGAESQVLLPQPGWKVALSLSLLSGVFMGVLVHACVP